MDWNLNYNSQNFTLTSLNLIKHQRLFHQDHHCCCYFHQIRSGLLLLMLLLRSLITVTHGKSKKFLSSFKFIFLFFCLCYIALQASKLSALCCVFLWTVLTVICELWLFNFILWIGVLCHVWTVDRRLVCVCGFGCVWLP